MIQDPYFRDVKAWTAKHAPGFQNVGPVGSPTGRNGYGFGMLAKTRTGEASTISQPLKLEKGRRYLLTFHFKTGYGQRYRGYEELFATLGEAVIWRADLAVPDVPLRAQLLFDAPAQAVTLTFGKRGVKDGGTGWNFQSTIWNVGLRPAADGDQGDLCSAEKPAEAPIELDVAREKLALLGKEVPGASRAVAWTQDGGTVPVPALADEDVAAPAALPEKAVAFGIEWPIAHAADRAEAFFVDRPPAEGSLALEVFDGQTWVSALHGLKTESLEAEKAIRWGFEPVCTRAMRVRVKTGAPRVSEFAVHAYPGTVKGRTVWPERLVKDNLLEKDLLRRKEEPSFETLSLHGLSMPAWATMGLKDHASEQAVAWDGRVLAPSCQVQIGLGEPPVYLFQVRDTVRRSLIDGWMPGIVVDAQVGDIRLRQTSFVAFADVREKSRAVFVRVEVENLSARPRETSVQASAIVSRRSVLTFRNGGLYRGDKPILLSQGPCRGADAPNSLAVDVELAPGATRSATFVTDVADAVDHDVALKRFKDYWTKLLAPGAALEVPEERLNNMYKAVLTHFFINAHGNVMPYGSAPSQYDGNLYGVEEGWVMLALSMFGFPADAQRYMDGTYLTKLFLRKVEKWTGAYGDRHQQYRNGLQPMYAVQAYRLSRDRQWIEKHLPLLKQCADWTIAQRRQTMKEEDGRKALHYGWMAPWSLGGDLSNFVGYSLYGNLACWRGLAETAWLLDDLGDKASAERYRGQAQEFYSAIIGTMEKMYRTDLKPAVLLEHVYQKDPKERREYYQLFAGVLLGLLPFDLSGKHADWVTDYLEQDNRTFCRMARFRRDVGPGGMDALYSIGHILTKLHQDKIREFLLGFYGYQVFNLEHGCFTSRETNAIYASDRHLRTAFPVIGNSDPLPCSSAVVLQFLRNMLVTEEFRGAGGYSGNLLLLYGAPRKWFEDGKTIKVARMPSHFGGVSFKVASRAENGVIEADIEPPSRNPMGAIKLRLRHPEGKRLRSVTVNGVVSNDFDPAKELITVTPEAAGKPIRVRAVFTE